MPGSFLGLGPVSVPWEGGPTGLFFCPFRLLLAFLWRSWGLSWHSFGTIFGFWDLSWPLLGLSWFSFGASLKPSRHAREFSWNMIALGSPFGHFQVTFQALKVTLKSCFFAQFADPFFECFCWRPLLLVSVLKAPQKPECDHLGRLKMLFSIGFYSIFMLFLVCLRSTFFSLLEPSGRRVNASRRRFRPKKSSENR